MKNIKSYILGLSALLIGATAFTGCQDDVDAPEAVVPVAVYDEAGLVSIMDVKEKYWSSEFNYANTVGDLKSFTGKDEDEGKHVYIKGRSIASDEPGNVFKSLYLQDESGAIKFSINQYNLYLTYRVGQEVVVDITGLSIGKYNGTMQFGSESDTNGQKQVSFLAPEIFNRARQLNGRPDAEKVEIISVPSVSALRSSTNPDAMRKYQNQLIRIDNVEFNHAGEATLSVRQSSGVSQGIHDAGGSATDSVAVRTSGYCTFWNNTLPVGVGSIVAMCDYYQTSNNNGLWQLTLIDIDGLIGFAEPGETPGAKDNPYSVLEVIDLENAGNANTGWVKGYIVGAVAPDVDNVAGNSDIEWSAPSTLANTLVIGESADTRDIAQAIVVALPSGSKLRELGNLRDNPNNFGKEILIYGTTNKFMGTFGLTDNNGTTEEFVIEGVGGGDVTDGDGSEASPYSAAQIRALNPSSTTVAVESGVWVSGYIVGSMPTGGTSTNIDGTNFSTVDAATTNMVLGPTADCTNPGECITIQLPVGDVRNALNLSANPGNLGKRVSLKGDVMKYCGAPGLKNVSAYKLDGAGTDPTPTPVDPVSSLDATFEGSTNFPAGWQQVQIAGNKSFYIREFSGNNYVSMSGYQGTAPFDQWLLTPAIDMSKVTEKVLSFRTQVNGYGSTTTQFEVYVLNSADVATATKTKLNPALPTAPASGYSDWMNSGNLDLSSFTGIIYIGFRYYATADANYATWGLDDVKVGTAGGGDTPTPPTPQPGEYKGDFNTFNGGVPKSSPYATYTNATGWTADNSIVLSGSDTGADQNPRFVFIGSASTMAVCMNGRAEKLGKITSPALSGGCGTLTFNYGCPFNEKSKISFTVKVLQNGSVVKEETVEFQDKIKEALSFSMDVNVKGEFSIEIVNNGLSANASANTERVAIWNLTWTD